MKIRTPNQAVIADFRCRLRAGLSTQVLKDPSKPMGRKGAGLKTTATPRNVSFQCSEFEDQTCSGPKTLS
jgi:hypothetical protein